MSLRHKIILLIVPIIVIPMMVSGWLSYSQLKMTAINKSTAQMDTLLEQYALYSGLFIHSAESNIRLFSNNELLRRYMVTQSEGERYEILQPLLMKQIASYQAAYPIYYEFRVVFPDGFEDFRRVNRPVDNFTSNEADNPFIKTVLQHKEGVFSRIQRNPDNDELALYVAIALNLKDRSIESASSIPKFSGYLVMTVDISEVISQMGLSSLGEHGYVFAANSSGEAQLFPDRLAPVLSGVSLNQQQMISLGVNGKSSDVGDCMDLSATPVIRTRFLGDEGIMKAVKLHDCMVLVTWLPVTEIDDQTDKLGSIVIGITLLAVMVTVVLLFGSLDYFVLDPIKKLRNAAIGIGRGDLTAPVSIRGGDEVGELAQSFDDMRKSMLNSHQHLEQLVDERTIDVRQALESAEKCSMEKSNFLSRMSHELRTPLNAILGFSELCEYDKNLTEHQKVNARLISSAGKHLLALINEVLDLSKIEAGRFKLSLETVSLSRVIDDCCLLIGAMANTHEISIAFDRKQCEGIHVQADHMRIKQVLLNLLSNAVKFNRAHGTVDINCVRTDDDYIRVNIKDTGRGISNENITQLFEPFNRLSAEYDNVEGAGIGLFITKQLVELMGGRIGIHSKPGMGTTFWVDLKESTAEPSVSSDGFKDEPAKPDEISVVSTGNPGILVAEDNETNQELMRQQLEVLGYRVDIADNGIDAFEKWRSGDYHLLMTDIHMPKMNGFELVIKIHNTQKFADNRIPIIAITADAMQDQVKRYLDAGLDDYITKPVNIEKLQQVLIKWLPARSAKT